jgi:hypothetical protein
MLFYWLKHGPCYAWLLFLFFLGEWRSWTRIWPIYCQQIGARASALGLDRRGETLRLTFD